MPDEKTAIPPAENEEGTETLETDEEPTVEDPEGDAPPEGEDDEKEEGDSYYEEQLKRISEENERLQAEAKERERQIELKDRAIEAQKKKLKTVPAGSVDVSSLEAKILSAVRVDAAVEAHASSEAEAKLIRHHLEHSIVRTGDPKQDVLNAKALANAARISDILSRESAEDAAEEKSLSSMSGGNARGPRGSGAKSAVRREAEKLLPKEMRKYLDPHVPK